MVNIKIKGNLNVTGKLTGSTGTILSDNSYTDRLWTGSVTTSPVVFHTVTVNTTKNNALIMLIYRGHLSVEKGQTQNIALNFQVDGTPVFAVAEWGNALYWQAGVFNPGYCTFIVGFILVPTAGSHTFAVTWQTTTGTTYPLENTVGIDNNTLRGNSRFQVIEY